MYMQSRKAFLILVVQDSEGDRPHSARTHQSCARRYSRTVDEQCLYFVLCVYYKYIGSISPTVLGI